ncbi:SWIM zinc finger family protein [Halovivax cerinus]|uniref:SWIM zinc finger family protein n=1 Tax=Halovivax cerinus TaxID=1487865 RepID=A0ABD5NNM5_9EURY|nr:SWIM zinc finger family protein [Halovivax cerinus]
MTWEAWEFTVTDPYLVEVTNASYGFEKGDHSYTVGVEERDGLAVPVDCECPADEYQEEYDCKHKVALATIGGPTVLNAAIEYESTSRNRSTGSEERADTIRADGGKPVETDDDCDCAFLSGLPCWPCYRDGEF